MREDWPVIAVVPSSDGKRDYEIRQGPEGDLFCPCKGFKWHNNCRHCKRVREENTPVLKFKITFKQGPKVIAEINGVERPLQGFKFGDVTEGVINAEQFLERLTGYRVHIESEM